MWTLIKLGKNHYKLVNEFKFVEFNITSSFTDDEIVFDNNMSDDNIIFMNTTYPTPDNEDIATIGNAYKYEGKTCVKVSFVDAHIINTNLPLSTAKFVIETECR